MIEQLAIAVAALAASAPAGSFSGIAKAIDGDSLVVGGHEVRLFGIDAPEFNQRCTRRGQSWACGAEAASRLSQLVNGNEVRCMSLGADQHRRTLARCTVGGTDVNRTMVATGYAVAFRRYSMDYVSAEESAKVGKRGIWNGEFQMPSDVRHANDYVIDRPSSDPPGRRELPVVSSARSKPQPSGSCRIKGNHSRKGERIYHLPGMPNYAQTVAEEIFCTEAQARAAGYRRSRADQHR